jgi:leucine-zipper-like transcriptional regulator 1
MDTPPHLSVSFKRYEVLFYSENRLYIIGGWLGQGPFAADDMHVLDLQEFKWMNYEFTGEPPGPCNMHTADSYEDKIYVFRGGDGRDYLNDLHELNTTTHHWRSV